MPFCPKCEEEYREGFEVCADCNVPLTAELALPKTVEAAEEQYAEDLFAEEDLVRFCPNCFVEFVMKASICPPCGFGLTSISRDDYAKMITQSPLEGWGRFDAPDADPELIRIFETSSPASAGFSAASLQSMGCEPVIGHDGLDDSEDGSKVGLYVRADEVEAAEMLIPEDASEWDEEVEGVDEFADPYLALVRRAGAYHEIRKYRHTITLCREALELDSERPDAFMALGRAVGRLGHVDQAAQSFREAFERSSESEAPDALYLLAIYCFLADDGSFDFIGTRAVEGMAALERFVANRPRTMTGHLLRLQSAHARGEGEIARSEVAEIIKLNRYLLEEDGLMSKVASSHR